jgi:hypothetical protein
MDGQHAVHALVQGMAGCGTWHIIDAFCGLFSLEKQIENILHGLNSPVIALFMCQGHVHLPKR